MRHVASLLFVLMSLLVVDGCRRCGPSLDSRTKVFVVALEAGVELYRKDEGRYPAQDDPSDPSRNGFPALFAALFGNRAPEGPGGRRAPYLVLQREYVAVAVGHPDRVDYRQATDEELLDDDVDKYLLDPWGNPYVYRVNRGKPRRPWMRNPDGVDIYSVGWNDVDDTASENRGPGDDDIGNW